jgi:hypothetical protein
LFYAYRYHEGEIVLSGWLSSEKVCSEGYDWGDLWCTRRRQWCSGYHACHWTQSSRVQTQPRTMDF